MKNQAVHFGVFTALALLFSYIESLIPFHIGIPGVKLGLANLIIVIALYKNKYKAGISAFCNKSVACRIFVWQYVQYSI